MKKPLAIIFVALIVVCGIFFFLIYRMGTNDAKALVDFPVAYNNYDRTISAYSKAVLASTPESTLTTYELARKVDEALILLQTKASVDIFANKKLWRSYEGIS